MEETQPMQPKQPQPQYDALAAQQHQQKQLHNELQQQMNAFTISQQSAAAEWREVHAHYMKQMADEVERILQQAQRWGTGDSVPPCFPAAWDAPGNNAQKGHAQGLQAAILAKVSRPRRRGH
jgi:hypothetical protein